MSTYFKEGFKSALDTVKADTQTINKTKQFVIENISKKKSPAYIYVPRFVAACLVFLLAVGAVQAHTFLTEPATFIEIEEGVKLGISRLNKVVSVECTDAGLEDIFQDLDILGKKAQAAAEMVVTAIEERITVPPADIPAYGWVVTRMEQVKDPAFGDNAYEITLHYKAWHNDPSVGSLKNVDITIELPSGVNAELYGNTGLKYDKAAGTLTKHIDSVNTAANINYKEVFTAIISGAEGRYTINSSVKIGDNTNNFTSSVVLEKIKPPVPTSAPITKLSIEDSYIITNEGVRLNKGSARPYPSYTAFVDVDKNVGDFEIYVKLTDADDVSADVKFSILEAEYPAVLCSDGYWMANVTELTGYGEIDIMIRANGKQAQAGKLLLLFAE